MQRLHEPTDEAKLERLTKSMIENGWQGAPLVTTEENMLLTGVHRSEAWRRAGYADYELPTIDIAELVPGFDAKLADLMEYMDWYDAMVRIVDGLPQEIINKYGLDLH